MATLLSVNVGRPKDVGWNGQTVRTGIYKAPVDGPVRVRRLNLDGDGQGDLAGHGGENRAVLVYQIESYHHWRRHLGRDDLAAGNFGENFTVSGLPDDSVCIGDRYRIGSAEFEVTQPRVTCFRVGMRLGVPNMPSLLVAHRRPGFYLRVITEGHVCAGDPIELTRRGKHRLSVSTVDALLYLPNPDVARMQQAADLTALSPGWAESFRERLAGRADAKPAAWVGFRTMRIDAIRRETTDVTSFELTGAEPLPRPLPGQYVTVRICDAGEPAPLRSYSLSGVPSTRRWRISVKREAGGLVSRWLHAHARVGTRVEIGAPRGEFCLAEGQEPVLLLSAGIGITPLLAMLHQLAATAATRRIVWVHTGRDRSSDPFREEVHSLLAGLPHAERHDLHTAPPGRRTDGSDIAALALPADTTAYVCGPTGFMNDMTAALSAVGIRRVHTEMFSARSAVNPGSVPTSSRRAPHPPPGEPGTGPMVTFSRVGLSVRWSAPHLNLLALAEACDVPTRYSCRSGVCHMCETDLITGEVDYVTEPLDPPGPRSALICCATPRTDLVLDM
ncbi:MOSC and FAD-binding oxidoreductase domain-containing protein [Mycolicibacterium goodii]|uniref:Sulfurase n=1 Tax=Mycolicibacterium goodii TaxID=134601 RepID=A0A0K0XCR1_MYCGD|nr:sulfurase [Mycolicibacterium goodii]